MKRHGDNPISRSGSEVFVSQSREWLTERLAYLPQVRLVFDEELPQSATRTEIMRNRTVLQPRAVNDD
jgi:hypothetical protein